MTRPFLLGTLVLVTVAGTVFAQPRPPAGAYDDRWGRDDRYGYGRDNYRGAGPVSQAMRDLQMISSRSFVDRHEAKHFQRAMEELSRFEQRSRQGVFDRGRLDRAIDNMQDLANAHQLHPRDRERLRNNLFALRRFRDGGDRYRYR